MFTGIVEEVGSIKGIQRENNGVRLTVSASVVLGDVAIGDSIAVDGVCQTVESFDSTSFTCFASEVTRGLTTFSAFIPGTRVNLERALTPTSRMGGHIVQGHVDGTGTVRVKKSIQNAQEYEITTSAEIMKYIVERGSVTVNGVSLTVVKRQSSSFILHLIPETIKETTFPELKEGMNVNIEIDIIAKYVESLLKQGEGKNMETLLKENGFM